MKRRKSSPSCLTTLFFIGLILVLLPILVPCTIMALVLMGIARIVIGE